VLKFPAVTSAFQRFIHVFHEFASMGLIIIAFAGLMGTGEIFKNEEILKF
jgi:hypothetical protein